MVVSKGVGYEHGDNTVIRLPDGRVNLDSYMEKHRNANSFEEDYYGRTEALDNDDLEQIQYEQQARQEQQMLFEEQAAEEAESETPTSTSSRGEGSTATPTPEKQPEKKQEKPAEQSTDDTRGKSGGDGLSRYGDMIKGAAENIGGTVEAATEMALSPGAGVVDWGIDLINKIPKKEIPGIDNPFMNDQVRYLKLLSLRMK